MLNVERVACGQHNQALVGAAGCHRVDRERNDVEIDPRRAHDSDLMTSDRRLRDTGHRVFNVLSRDRRRNRTHMAGTDESGFGNQLRAQRPFLRQQVQRMTSGSWPTMLAHRAHDISQRFTRRTIAVQQLERFAIVRTDTDFQPNSVGVRISDDTTYLETINLAAQHSMLDDWLGTTVDDQRLKRGVLDRHSRRSGKRFGFRRLQIAASHLPNAHRRSPPDSASRQHAGTDLGKKVEFSRVLPQRPSHRWTKPTLGTIVEQYPSSTANHQRGTTTEFAWLQNRARFAIPYKRRQLDREQLLAGGHLPLRSP